MSTQIRIKTCNRRTERERERERERDRERERERDRERERQRERETENQGGRGHAQQCMYCAWQNSNIEVGYTKPSYV